MKNILLLISVYGIYLVADISAFENETVVGNIMVAAKGQFPYQAMIKILYAGGSISLCSGSIISNEWILTAATCTQGFFGGNATIKVVVGSNLLDGGLHLDIERWYVHDNYSESSGIKYNVAVLKLKEKLAYSNLIQPVKLPNSSVPDAVRLTMSGLGAESNSTYIGTFYNFLLPISSSWCNLLSETILDFENAFCALVENHNSKPCFFDYGNPIVWYNGVQYGISSRDKLSVNGSSYDCNNLKQCIDVFSHLEWILKTTKLIL